MIFNPASRELSSRLSRLIPDIEQIVCSRFVNYLTLNIQTKNNSWSHSGQLINDEHMQAVAYLHANFKNNIVNRKSLANFDKLIEYLQQSGNQQLLQHLSPSRQKIAQRYRRNFYIFDDKLEINEIVDNPTIRNKAYSKVICFAKEKPIQVNRQFQKFCIEHNVRALGLTQFTVKSLINQIFKMSKSPTLIHELVSNDLSIYKQENGKGVPTQLILFLYQIKSENLKKKSNFISFKQMAKNYLQRESFSQNSKPNTPHLKICRFQHLHQVQKYQDAIAAQQLYGTDDGEEN